VSSSRYVGPFGYVAADAFYYLVVARNVARHGSFSFDGRHPTNGFHPLWQLLTSALDFATEHLGLEQFTLYVAIFASLALIAGGIALLATALARTSTTSTPSSSNCAHNFNSAWHSQTVHGSGGPSIRLRRR
jgi:hypothetical protein